MSEFVLRCYCCSKPIENIFCLVSMRDETDRPFIAHIECAKTLDDVKTITVKKAVE